MSVVCPTVTARSNAEYEEQIVTVSSFSQKIHIDLADGEFANKSVGVKEVYWPENSLIDIHLMYQKPADVIEEIITKQPTLIIIHAESSGDIKALLARIKSSGIMPGLAILQDTSIESVKDLLPLCDHILIFSGSLGSFGGSVDYALIKKISQARAINPDIEIGWDGGINADNIVSLRDGGVDILNVGGAIQKANHPQNAFRELVSLIS